MKKKVVIYALLFLAGIEFFGCSEDSENYVESASVEAFRQRCVSIAKEYGIEVFLNNEYVMERIDWPDERLRSEFQLVADEFRRKDSLGTDSLRKPVRHLFMNGNEYGTRVFKTVDDNFTIQETRGNNLYAITGRIRWNENGDILTLQSQSVSCTHNCASDSCRIEWGLHFATNFAVRGLRSPLPYYSLNPNGKLDLTYWVSWSAEFNEPLLNVYEHSYEAKGSYNYKEYTF